MSRQLTSSALLLAVLTVAGGRSPVQAQDQQALSALIGEWSKSKVSSIDFVNRSTGAHSDPSGERLHVRFFPDGHYKLGWLLQSSLYNCTSSVYGEKVGIYQVRGDALSMKDTTSVLTSRDNCHPHWNYEKHPPLAETTYQLRFGQSKYGVVLLMRGPDGKETMYSRESGPGLLSR
jgi:hypothetical protein